MQKRFVSWAAVSSLPQAKKISVDDQLKTNLEHIEKWEGVLYKELPIRGKSRSIISWEKACATIPEYAALRDMIEKREFDVLIYLDRSRLGRKALLIDTIVEMCHEAGIVTYPTESPPNTLEPKGGDFAHRIVGAIESIVAQEEVTKMKRRHAFGMAARVRNGDFPARVPYGWSVRYEVVNEKPVQIIEIDEAAKTTILRIIDLYVDDALSFRSIAEVLRNEGVPSPRGQTWKTTTVERILCMAWRYAGIVELNKRSKTREYIRAKSRWPVLITEERAKQIIAERARRAHARRSVESPHRFSQIVWCEKCHRRMQARYQLRYAPATREQTENYRCVTDGEPSHAKNQIAAFYIEDAIEAAILYAQKEANRQRILDGYTDQRPHIEAGITKANQRLAKHEEAVQRADDAYVLGKMDYDRYSRQLENLSREHKKILEVIAGYQQQLDEQLREAGRADRLIVIADEGLQMLRSHDIVAANAWFRQHIQVWIDNDNPSRRVLVEYL